jgi:hypothetical protein
MSKLDAIARAALEAPKGKRAGQRRVLLEMRARSPDPFFDSLRTRSILRALAAEGLVVQLPSAAWSITAAGSSTMEPPDASLLIGLLRERDWADDGMGGRLHLARRNPDRRDFASAWLALCGTKGDLRLRYGPSTGYDAVAGRMMPPEEFEFCARCLRKARR